MFAFGVGFHHRQTLMLAYAKHHPAGQFDEYDADDDDDDNDGDDDNCDDDDDDDPPSFCFGTNIVFFFGAKFAPVSSH